MAGSRTITITGERKRRKHGLAPHLFLALRCDRPADAGARFSLAGADAVTIGRSDTLTAAREGKELRIGIPDGRMSSKHLRLHHLLGEWVAEDAGSKNGTLLDGSRLERGAIGDGALIEAGRTFLLFRRSLPEGAGFIDGRELEPQATGLATLVPALAAEFERLAVVARSRLPILLLGETGTGKEVAASAIHRLSGRSGPFLAMNCGAVPAALVESELFGFRKGAFSGALEDRPGLVRSAEGGTLLLDEIGDLPLPAQAALLRVLQEEEVMPLGATRPIKVDVRVVAATHRGLDELAAEGKFRADLLARVSGHRVSLPPLRERREDFGLIVAALLRRLAPDRPVALSVEAGRVLLSHSWPGNVRELEKCLSAAVLLARDGVIEVDHLPAAVRERRAPAAAPVAALSEEERRRRDALVAQLREHAGNVTAVARAMGKARTQVQRWLRRYGLDPLSYRR